MLTQLDHERMVQQEMAASARAADAQHELLEAIPIPLVVTAVPDHEGAARQPAVAELARRQRRRPVERRAWAIRAVRSRFFQRLADRDGVDEFEVRWKSGTEPVWAVLSARRLGNTRARTRCSPPSRRSTA